MTEKPVILWVSLDFKKMIKKMAVDENKPVVQFTKDIVNRNKEDKDNYTWFGKGKRLL